MPQRGSSSRVTPPLAMRCGILVAMCALAAPSAAVAQRVESIGSFDNVRVSTATGEPHCYGYSLHLWQSGSHVFGLLDRHEGLCGDPPCEAVTSVTHDARTGSLTFSAFGMRFDGTLRRGNVRGTLGTERLRLERKQAAMDAASDKTIDAWCDFWRDVPRCKGVGPVCSAIGSKP